MLHHYQRKSELEYEKLEYYNFSGNWKDYSIGMNDLIHTFFQNYFRHQEYSNKFINLFQKQYKFDHNTFYSDHNMITILQFIPDDEEDAKNMAGELGLETIDNLGKLLSSYLFQEVDIIKFMYSKVINNTTKDIYKTGVVLPFGLLHIFRIIEFNGLYDEEEVSFSNACIILKNLSYELLNLTIIEMMFYLMLRPENIESIIFIGKNKLDNLKLNPDEIWYKLIPTREYSELEFDKKYLYKINVHANNDNLYIKSFEHYKENKELITKLSQCYLS